MRTRNGRLVAIKPFFRYLESAIWNGSTWPRGASGFARPRTADAHRFVNSSGNSLTWKGFAMGLAVRVGTAARVIPWIGAKTVTPQMLRHRCARHTLEATGDIRQVALWLDHASIRSTEMYLRTDPASELDTLAAGKAPVVRRGSFDGVQDEWLSMLSGLAAPSGT